MKLKRLLATVLIMILCFCVFSVSGIAEKSDYDGQYWIKVNKSLNVATVYERCGNSWEPVRVMRTSCGNPTPTGTFYTKANWSWGALTGYTYGQCCVCITGHYLFHSVWYYNNQDRDSQSVYQFNNLGKTVSHGCVRLAAADSRWVYEHCPVGTKVTIFKGSDPGKLGIPATYKMPSSAGSQNWDPTDVSSKNPYYQALPILTQKVYEVQYGDKNCKTAKSLVAATQTNGKSVKSCTVNSVTKYSASKDEYVSAKFSNTSEGLYKIKYTVVSSKGVKLTKTFRFLVKDVAKPVIQTVSAEDLSRTVLPGTKNAASWLDSAKMKNGTNVKSACMVSVIEPDGTVQLLTYEKAKSYVFEQQGEYTIKYIAANKNDSSVSSFKTLTVTVTDEPSLTDAPGGKEHDEQILNAPFAEPAPAAQALGE